MATVLEKVQKLTYAENFAMALYQVFTSIKSAIISENLVLLTQMNNSGQNLHISAPRPVPIVLVKCWKVAHWNTKKLLKNCQKSKKLLPKFQKLLPKFLAIFI